MSKPVKIRRTREQQRAHHRGLLIDALRQLLETESYSTITLDSILATSGVARATFYSNFSDRAGLLMAVAGDIYAQAITVAQPWWDLAPDAVESDLEDALARIFDLYIPNKIALAALAEAAAFEPLIRASQVRLQQGSIEKLAGHIAAGQRGGTIRDTLIPHETAGWIIWMIERGLYQMATAAGPAELDRLVRSLTDVMWHALYLQATQDGPPATARDRR